MTSTEDVPSGRQQLRFEFEVTGPPDFSQGLGTTGRVQLYFGDRLVGYADIPEFVAFGMSDDSPLRNDIDAALSDLHRQGVIRQIVDRWTD